MTDRELMQQVLEALEGWNHVLEPKPDAELISALRSRLAQPEQCQCPECQITFHASDCAVHNEPAYPKGACSCGAQPEQEPVAWMWRDGTVTSDPDRADGTWTPLYTTPPQRKPLTDDQIEGAFFDMGQFAKVDLKAFARAIEAAHGIKGEA